MAGIGFILRRLSMRGDLTGILMAFWHATMATSGPWILTVITIGSLYIASGYFAMKEAMEALREILLYNFSFSLVASAPLSVILTRYLSDCIYKRDVSPGAGLLIGSLFLFWSVTIVPITLFYFGVAAFSASVRLLAVGNFLLVGGIWIVNGFISALKYYNVITLTYMAGLVISFAASLYLSYYYSQMGVMLGFNLGLCFILASLTALIFCEYPKTLEKVFGMLIYFKKYKEVALGGLFYSIAIWVDKWIMWFAPGSELTVHDLRFFPFYDSSMFSAYLSVLPSIALFMLSHETSFFGYYVAFYGGISEHINFRQIQALHQKVIGSVIDMSRTLLLLQSCICGMCVLLAPKLIEILGFSYMQIGIFRFGLLGAAFQAWALFASILLAYFDDRKGVVIIQATFLFSNVLFTLLVIPLGFAYYGLGYFLSTVVTFAIAAVLLQKYLWNLPFHAFITQQNK